MALPLFPSSSTALQDFPDVGSTGRFASFRPRLVSFNKQKAWVRASLSVHLKTPGSKPCSAQRQRTVTHAAAGSLGADSQSFEAASLSGGLSKEEQQRKLWYMAIKPPMYSVAIVPILVASGAAFATAGVFSASQTSLLLLAACMIIAWLNLSNDAFDAETGVDVKKAESMVNLTGNRTGVLALANVFLLGGVGLLARLVLKGDPRPAVMLAVAIACGYVYQGPPFRLSYKGLGEPLCFFAFGPLATCAFYLTQVGGAATLGPGVAVASVLVGITTSVILFCSHFHQIETDLAAGKMSPLVRLGSAAAGVQVLRWVVASPYFLTAAGVLLGWLPATCLAASILSLPQAFRLVGFAEETHRVPALIRPLKLYALTWHSALGVALTAGFAVSRLGPFF